jgi:hypothetical protein
MAAAIRNFCISIVLRVGVSETRPPAHDRLD